MTDSTAHRDYRGLARLKLFLALSRTPHGVLDMTTPAFGALLWLGAFPPAHITILGIITVFAGYTAVYALNDVIDYRVDREKARLAGGLRQQDNYLDAVLIRHPMAQGLLSYEEGLLWAIGWSVVALVGGYLLNPVCVFIFLGGCLLEIAYCLLLKISPFRTLISGAVKTSGAVAAVFAVDPNPSATYVAVLFLWLFFWEIGGQNVPADWTDIEEDRRLKAQTIPVRLGTKGAAHIVLWTLILSILINQVLIAVSSSGYRPAMAVISFAVGTLLLLMPAIRLFKSHRRADAMALFNKSSYYPVAMLGGIILTLLMESV